MLSLLYFRMASAMEAASTVWDYLVMGHKLFPSDLILVCCSNDLRVADRAVELYREVIFILAIPITSLENLSIFAGKA